MTMDADRIACGLGPQVWKDGDDRAYLMKIRTGEVKPEDAAAECEKTIARLRTESASWAVQEDGDWKYLNDVLVKFRMTPLDPDEELLAPYLDGPECTCYELVGAAHQPGCQFYKAPSAGP